MGIESTYFVSSDGVYDSSQNSFYASSMKTSIHFWCEQQAALSCDGNKPLFVQSRSIPFLVSQASARLYQGMARFIVKLMRKSDTCHFFY